MKTQMEKNMKDVHTEHCCAKHGCKYGDEDCTVIMGIAPQSFDCESCDWDSQNLTETEKRLDRAIELLQSVVNPFAKGTAQSRHTDILEFLKGSSSLR